MTPDTLSLVERLEARTLPIHSALGMKLGEVPDALCREAAARIRELEQALEAARALIREAVDELGCTIELYHKNGPHWTSADGEMFDVAVIMDREPLIERMRQALTPENAEKKP